MASCPIYAPFIGFAGVSSAVSSRFEFVRVLPITGHEIPILQNILIHMFTCRWCLAVRISRYVAQALRTFILPLAYR